MRDKKLTELLHVRLLADLLHVVPDGDWDEDGESPDLTIRRADDTTLGIEVTEFHSDQRVKTRESEQESIVAAARQEHSRRDGPPLMVRVYWNAFDVVPKSERSTLVKELATTISANAPTADGGQVLDTTIDDTIVLPAHVDRIDIYRYDEHPDTDWMSVRSGFLPSVTAAELTAEIDRKSALVARFRRVDELWLLVVFGGRSPSTWAAITANALQAQYAGPFDRVFLVSYAPRFAYELRAVKSFVAPM